jgi:alkylation response protein AidB-like acyl-CoA dehydrogenase
MQKGGQKMKFAFSEEQEMLKKSAQDFLVNECGKKVLKELEESETGFSRKLWDDMAGLGWMGILVPEAQGGVELTLLELAVLFEEYGRAALNGPMLGTVLGTLALLAGDNEALKQALLPEVASGKLIMTLALQEPEVAYDPKFVAAQAEARDGGFVLSGTKVFVPYATVAEKILVAARTSGNPGDADGITLFCVDGKAQGITTTPLNAMAGDKQFQVDLEGVEASSDTVLGTVDRGLPLLVSILEKATAVQCAEMVGGAQYELDITAEYGRTRVQFERAIGTFQAVQHRLADMFMDVLGARLTTYQAVWRLSQGMPAARETAIAKIFTNTAARRVAFSAQQIHAGMGYDLDHELHYYYRRQKALELKLGSVPAQLDTLGTELGL